MELLTIAILIFVIIALKVYFNGPSTNLAKRMDGKVLIVTGSTSGIGKETALTLLMQGATVIFANRNKTKTINIFNSLKDNSSKERAIYIHLDLSSFKSIKQFILTFREKFKSLDILVNNGGCYKKTFNLTEDGIEETIQVNTLAPIALTHGLMDLLSRSNGRVINVASRHHRRANLDIFKQMKEPEQFDMNVFSNAGMQLYSLSKLCLIYFTLEMNDLICELDANVKMVSLHPGVVVTDIARDYNGYLMTFVKAILTPFLWLLFKSINKGAQTTLHLCYMDHNDIIGGSYYKDCKWTLPDLKAFNKANRGIFIKWANYYLLKVGIFKK